MIVLSSERATWRVGALPLAFALALLPMPAAAEDEPLTDHDDVTVEGVRQPYRGSFALREIPQAITTIDAGTLQENNILRLTDALDLNASVVRQNSLGGLWDSFRGARLRRGREFAERVSRQWLQRRARVQRAA